MRIYHYSNKELKTVKVDFFGNNSFTLNDKKASTLKRSFFYTGLNCEKFFRKAKHVYYADIDNNKIYNLKDDNSNFINVEFTIHEILLKIKKAGYSGILYNNSYMDIVNLFYDIEVKKMKS